MTDDAEVDPAVLPHLLRGPSGIDRPADAIPGLHAGGAVQAYPIGRRALKAVWVAAVRSRARASRCPVDGAGERSRFDPVRHEILNFIIREVIRHHESHSKTGRRAPDPGTEQNQWP